MITVIEKEEIVIETPNKINITEIASKETITEEDQEIIY